MNKIHPIFEKVDMLVLTIIIICMILVLNLMAINSGVSFILGIGVAALGIFSSWIEIQKAKRKRRNTEKYLYIWGKHKVKSSYIVLLIFVCFIITLHYVGDDRIYIKRIGVFLLYFIIYKLYVYYLNRIRVRGVKNKEKKGSDITNNN